MGSAACASKTNEPFNAPADPQSLPNLHKAGFSDSEFRRCLSTAYADYSQWKTTPIAIYNEIRTLGAPIQFQTHAPNSIDWAATMQYGISLGASAIEIWNETRPGSYNKIPPWETFQWSAALRRNKSM